MVLEVVVDEVDWVVAVVTGIFWRVDGIGGGRFVGFFVGDKRREILFVIRVISVFII